MTVGLFAAAMSAETIDPPQVIAVAGSTDPANVTVPAHEAGDRLILIAGCYFDAVSSAGSVGGQAWVKRFGARYEDYTCVSVFEIVSRSAAASASTISVSGHRAADPPACHVYVIRNSSPSLALVSARAATTTGAADCPSLTHASGDVPTLWIAGAAGHDSRYNITAAPADYTDLLVTKVGSSSGDGICGTARRTTEDTDTQNPGSFSNTGANLIPFTLAIRPAI